MKVLIACERWGIIRDAFLIRGHEAISCDLLPCESPGPHYQGDVRDILSNGFDLMIAHPPCIPLASSGRWYYKDRIAETIAAASFFMELVNAPIGKICIENPVGIMSCLFRKPDQYIDPYYFDEPERKRTGLWLKNLPRLNGSIEVGKDPGGNVPEPKYTDSDGTKRYFTDSLKGSNQLRSRTFQSIANAMVKCWG